MKMIVFWPSALSDEETFHTALLKPLYLYNVEFGKQVAVCQGEGVSIQVQTFRLRFVWVLVQLVGQGRLKVLGQLHQRGQEFLLQH